MDVDVYIDDVNVDVYIDVGARRGCRGEAFLPKYVGLTKELIQECFALAQVCGIYHIRFTQE